MNGGGHLGWCASISLPRLSRNPITCFAICCRCLPAHILVCFSPLPILCGLAANVLPFSNVERDGSESGSSLSSGRLLASAFSLETLEFNLKPKIQGWCSLGKVEWRAKAGVAGDLQHSPTGDLNLNLHLATLHLGHYSSTTGPGTWSPEMGSAPCKLLWNCRIWVTVWYQLTSKHQLELAWTRKVECWLWFKSKQPVPLVFRHKSSMDATME